MKTPLVSQNDYGTVNDRLLMLQSMAYARLSRIDSTSCGRSTSSTRPTELMCSLEDSETSAYQCTVWTFKTFEATGNLRTSRARETYFVCESDIHDSRQHDGPFQVLERRSIFHYELAWKTRLLGAANTLDVR